MVRIMPFEGYANLPCLICAVSCALGYIPCDLPMPELKPDGYATLRVANKFIRKYLNITRRTDYKRGERPRLGDLNVDKALVCVYGHFVYVENGCYYSFFDNVGSNVVCLWEINELKGGNQ